MKTLMLMIMDGFGFAPEGNAIKAANTRNLDAFL